MRIDWRAEPTRMLLGFAIGLAAGLIVHFGAPGAGWVDVVTTYVTQPIGQIFLRLMFMLVLPLLFSALVMGVSEMGDIRALGRVGWRTLLYTFVASTIAVSVAMLLVNLIRPGDGVDPAVAQQLLAEAREGAQAIVQTSREAPTGVAALLAIVPSNIVAAAAANDVLAVMFFALLFGIGLVLAGGPATVTLRETIGGIFEVSMRLIGLVIRLAPIAVACFMFNLAVAFGWELLAKVAALAGVVLLGLGFQLFVTLPLAVKLFGGMSPAAFFRNSREAMVMAFATSSSNATLPTALRVAEEKLRLPPRIARFVLTIGATANQNGTAIYEGVTVLFIAQFFGVDLTLQQQLIVLVVAILGGIGTAGVPGGSLPVVALILAMVGVPPEGVGLILGVDRFLDMCRTVLNVTGDLAAAVVVSGSEREEAEPVV